MRSRLSVLYCTSIVSALLVPLTIGHAQSASTAVTERQSPVRRPAVSSLGTLAFEQDGHLYFRFADGTTTRVSAGTAYHRDASFTSGALYFASDSAGHYDIWRLPLDGRDRPSGAATRLTTSSAHDVSPSAGTNGVIVFQRGLGGESRAWVREADGRERRLSTTERTERPPGAIISFYNMYKNIYNLSLCIIRQGKT